MRLWEELRNQAEESVRMLPSTAVYNVPVRGEQPTVIPAPARLDVRRDVRLAFAVSRAAYNTSGYLIDEAFDMPGLRYSASSVVYVQVFGYFPTGTDATVNLYDAATGSMLGAILIDSNTGMRHYQFTVTRLMRAFRVQISMTGDGTRSPTVTRYRVIRDGAYIEPLTTEKIPSIVSDVSLQGQSDDAATAMGLIQVRDATAALEAPLKKRVMVPIIVETSYDPLDQSKRSVLFQGYIVEARGAKRGTDRGQDYPSPEWHDYRLRLAGESARLQRASSWQGFNFSEDPESEGKPYKITAVIDWLLRQAGYGSSQIDVPDIPLRLPYQGQLILDWRTDIVEKVQDLARNYLGHYLLFDPNAGTDNKGMWRLRPYPRPPYNNLAEFLFDVPGLAVLPHIPGAYPEGSATSPLGNLQAIIKTFVRYGTLERFVIPPEGNMVEVYGTTPVQPSFIQSGPSSKSGEVEKLVARAFNFESAWFMDDQPIVPDPDSPDYLGFVSPITVLDTGLTSQEAVNFVCRRTYDLACHGRRAMTFEAPLILVTDEDDSEQIRPRPLRYGDPVLVEGTQYIVRSVQINYQAYKGGDGFQFARYELETPLPPADVVAKEPPAA